MPNIKSAMKRVCAQMSKSGVRFCQSLGQTGLFPVGRVLMDNALGHRFIDSGGGGAQLRCGGGGALVQSDLILLDGSFDARLHHTIPQVLFLAHLHALHSGLDVRQLPSPPHGFVR